MRLRAYRDRRTYFSCYNGETVNHGLAHNGGAKSESIDLGLALLSVLWRAKEQLSLHDIAAFCGCTRQQIHLIEKSGLRKLRRALPMEGLQEAV